MSTEKVVRSVRAAFFVFGAAGGLDLARRTRIRSATPHPRIRRLLALWYLRRSVGVDEMEPYASALNVLLADVPEPLLPAVTLKVLRAVGEGFPPDGEQEAPRWLEAVRRRRVGWVLGDP